MIGAPSSAAVTITEPGQVIGTPGYMSPEQARGNPTDHRTDIWSFGCILYEMLTGTCPFPGPTASEALASILKTDPDWQRLPAEAGADVREIIHKCLEKNPAQRYQSANTLCEDLRKSKEALTAPPPKPVDMKAILSLLRKPRIAACSVLVFLMFCLALMWLIHRSAKIRWARDEAIPEIERLIDQDEYFAAFSLALKAEKYVPEDAMLRRLWPEMSRRLSIITTPPRADISYKQYSDTDGPWLYLGQSPQENIKFPLGLYRCKFAKEGFESRESIVRYEVEHRTLKITLQETGSNPGMVLIQMTPSRWIQSGSEVDYLIDKYEVTNEQFKKFVDAGGYTKQEYWRPTFLENGSVVPWKQATEGFQDTSGRPGPSTWVGGTYPSNQRNYPVSGVSWYEAAAYAEFVGKDLPPVACWSYAAGQDKFSGGASFSNFGDGPAPVGSYQGVGVHGLYDMAGNVREWCWNATDDSGNKRYIRGGSPWDRDRGNGFRCIRCIRGKDSIPSSYLEPKERPIVRDPNSITRLSEEEFRNFQTSCAYDPSELDPNVESSDDSPRYWRKEKITFNAAYDGERVTAHLFLPKGVKPPYQPVVFFPMLSAVREDTFAESRMRKHDFVIKSGRAAYYPIYKGTYDRRFDGGAAVV
jgi:hypothetical protein